MIRDFFVPLALSTVLVSGLANVVHADDPARIKSEAPPEHEVWRHVRGGAFFIARPLKQKHDELLSQVRQLQAAVRQDRIEGGEALARLRRLQDELQKLASEIEAKKVLVSPVKVLRQTETVLLTPGPERLLVITADAVRILGWDGPQIKCELEKTVLAGDEQAADQDFIDEQFAALRVVHRHGPAPELVGKTPAERAADEQKFLDGPDGRKLDAAQRAARARFLQEIAASYAIYEPFQGLAIDTMELTGLTFEQGNRQITVEARSPGGGGSLGSDWQRHASLTVYVPSSHLLALRGCQVGLDVRDVDSTLILTSAGSRDRDYQGQFLIRGVEGSVSIDNAPIDLIENVRGNVKIVSTTEMINTGTTHHDDMRHAYTPPPRITRLADIEGDATAWFGRADLTVENVRGAIDIRNEFGDTRLKVANPLASRAHRVLSLSGKIAVEFNAASLGRLPLAMLTSSGEVRTNLPQQTYPEISFTSGGDDGSRRDWRGFHTAKDDGPAGTFEFFERVGEVLHGEERSPGLDLISRSGEVVVSQVE